MQIDYDNINKIFVYYIYIYIFRQTFLVSAKIVISSENSIFLKMS